MILSYAQSNLNAQSRPQEIFNNIAKVVLGSFALALCAQVSIKLPFTPVPIALAPHAAIFMGALLGRKLGFMAVVAYLMQGALGLPVFACGASGIATLLGPTGGYLFGFAAAAFLTGFIVEKSKHQLHTSLALIIGNLVIYAFGLPYLSLFIGFKAAFTLGLLPFVIGDALKLLMINSLFKKTR
jgi:biotin transport system substrate-specific component